MFKILKKDRIRMLWLFSLELLIGIALIIGLIVLEKHIEVVVEFQEYSIFVVLAYFILVNFVNIFAISKYLNKTEKYLNRTDITIASIFGNEVSPVFEFGNIAILVYNEIDEDDDLCIVSEIPTYHLYIQCEKEKIKEVTKTKILKK